MWSTGARRPVWLVGILVAAAVATGTTDGGSVSGASEFVGLPAPARLLDTRPGTATIDGRFVGIGMRPAGSTLILDVAGRAGVPVDATSVVLNVTAAIPAGWGFVTVHPTGTSRPNASNLNYAGGDTIANTVITRVGAGGAISIYTYAATHLIVDIAGYLPAGSFTPLPAPQRLVDTRPGAATIDGQHAGVGVRPSGNALQVHVAGRAGIPTGASAVVLNIAAVDSRGWGYLTEHPTGSSRPNASNLNYTTGKTIANTVIGRLGAGGDICVYTYGATHLIVDVAGYLAGPPPPPAGPTCPNDAPAINTKLEIGDHASGSMTFDGEYLWAARPGQVGGAWLGYLDVIDPDRNVRVDTVWTIGMVPRDLAFDGTNVWATAGQHSPPAEALLKVDAVTHIVEAIIPLAGQPGALAFDGTHLWVVRGGAHVVSKIDPASGSVVDDIPVPPDPHDVYFDGRYLWVGSSPDAFDIFGPTDGRLTKIDPKSNTVVLSIPYTCSRLGAFDGQALWVAQAWTGGCAGSLDRIDPGNGAIIGGNPDIGPSWVDYDGTSIWVGYGDVGSIQQIDPATARVVASLDWRDGVYVPITFLGFFDGRYLWVPSGLQLLKIQMEH